MQLDFRRPFTSFLSETFLALILIGCASHPPISREPLAEIANPARETERLEAEVKSAREAHLPLLAPVSFKRATQSLAMAHRYRQGDGRREDWVRALETGLAALRDGRRHADEAHDRLETVLEARRDARKAGGNEFVASYPDAEAALVQLTTAIEQDDAKYVDAHVAEVRDEFKRVEIAAVTNRFLGGSQLVLAEAVKEGASDYAPQTLTSTESKLAAMQEWIARHPRATDAIREKADEAYEAANRLLRVTREGHAFATRSPEDNVLFMEKQLASVNEKLAKAEEAREKLVAEVDGDDGDDEGDAAEAARTPRSRVIDEKLAQVRRLFSPREAEVSRNGEKVWVRLHGLQFGPGRAATLTAEDRKLVGKVKSAIAYFPAPRVMVLGRTDTTGPLKQRDALARARAVRQYLVSLRAVPDDRLVAQGVRSEESDLVVDVVIEPERTLAE